MTAPTCCKLPASPTPNNAANLEEDIRHLAYNLYEVCGRQEGHDLDDWLFAEKQIKRSKSCSVAPEAR